MSAQADSGSFVWWITFLCFWFWGEPDLYDHLVAWLQAGVAS